MTIYKYEIPVLDKFEVRMPLGAQILSVQLQGGNPCVWAMVEEFAPKEPRWFRIFGTGHPLKDVENFQFIDTFQMQGGALVFHLFEEQRVAISESEARSDARNQDPEGPYDQQSEVQ